MSKSVSFYKDKLHFHEEFIAKDMVGRNIKPGGLEIALYTPGKGGSSSNFGRTLDFHLLLPEDDFSNLADNLLKSGDLLENRIHTSNDDSIFIDVVDPDGNILKIMQCRD